MIVEENKSPSVGTSEVIIDNNGGFIRYDVVIEDKRCLTAKETDVIIENNNGFENAKDI